VAYDNTNTGLLKKNDRKEKDSHPDYRGMVNVDGVDYWLSAWIKVGKEGSKLAGQKFFSLALEPMEDQRRSSSRRDDDRGGRGRDDRGRGGYDRDDRGRGRDDDRRDPRGQQGSGFDDMDDDIPF